MTVVVPVVVLGLWLLWSVASAVESVTPVDPLTQCKAMVELVVKDRANAQMEAAYFAARVQELTQQTRTLEGKIKALEQTNGQ